VNLCVPAPVAIRRRLGDVCVRTMRPVMNRDDREHRVDHLVYDSMFLDQRIDALQGVGHPFRGVGHLTRMVQQDSLDKFR